MIIVFFKIRNPSKSVWSQDSFQLLGLSLTLWLSEFQATFQCSTSILMVARQQKTSTENMH